MSEAHSIFTHHAAFDPAGDFEAFLKETPARWVVYLLADEHDRPVQLLCVKNLRASLKRRLGVGEAEAGPSRRVNYRDLVRRIHWRRVDSAFEADWIYYEAARIVFPRTYQGMVGFRPAWFVHVDPDANFPRYIKTTDLTRQSGIYIGPVEDKHAAARLIQLAEDSFDLCRYHHVLVESPHAKPCAYKEMGKCPAPCDGSISMEQYRRLVGMSVAALVEPRELLREQDTRMRQAAGELRFETAAKIKQLIDQIAQLGKGPFRHVGTLNDVVFLSLQHGPRAATAKAFLIMPGRIEEIAGIIHDLSQPAALLRLVLERAEEHVGQAVDQAGAERIGVVAHHLFAARGRGVFLRLATIDEKSIARGYRELLKQAAPQETEGEGVMKELQAL